MVFKDRTKLLCNIVNSRDYWSSVEVIKLFHKVENLQSSSIKDVKPLLLEMLKGV